MNLKGSKLQRDIETYLQALGYYTANIIVAGKDGTHDIHACIEGKFASIEVKGTGDTVKRLQEAKRKRILNAGGYAIYARSLDDVRALVNQIKASH